MSDPTSEPDRDVLLKLLVRLARYAVEQDQPVSGDLVVEVSMFRHDPDAIGWLIGHDQAPYEEGEPTDGSVPMREVWDIIPLRGLSTEQEQRQGYQRWENAEFRKLPATAADVVQGLRQGRSGRRDRQRRIR